MMDWYTKLTQLVLPPEPSPARTAGEWTDFEQSLGTTLPEDYQRVINGYGTGAFDNFIWIFSPFAEVDSLQFAKRSTAIIEAEKVAAAEDRREVITVFFPVPGGLLPFGATDNGDELHWSCHESPDSWPICVRESRSRHYQQFQMSLCEFLVALLSRRLRVDAFPDDFPSDRPAFTPFPGKSNNR